MDSTTTYGAIGGGYQDARVLAGPQTQPPEPNIMQVLQALHERVQQLEKLVSINADETRFVRARLGI
jgi:hypothetical protein